nr:hypothetical protein [Tanacetum cinerariifolium]
MPSQIPFVFNKGALGLSNPDVFPVRHKLMIVVSSLHGWNMSLVTTFDKFLTNLGCDLKSFPQGVFGENKPLLIQLTPVAPSSLIILYRIPELLDVN